MVGKMLVADWLQKQLKEVSVSNYEELKIFGETFLDITNEDSDTNQFRSWSLLKLMFLNYSLGVCTPILKKNFHKIYYVDFFAGSGLVKLKGFEKDIFLGSPFLTMIKYGHIFDKYFLCEKDKKYLAALKNRVEKLQKSNVVICEGDFKLNINKILDEAKRENAFVFFFVDPYGMHFHWEFMESILRVRSDIVFNFMTAGITRDVPAGIKRENPGRIQKFFGDDCWRNFDKNVETMLDCYKNKIKIVRPNAIIETINIKSRRQKGFNYHLFFITNKTRSRDVGDLNVFKKGKWMNAILKIKVRIERLYDMDIEEALSVSKQEQKTLTEFSKNKIL